jgi:hypothetical protein
MTGIVITKTNITGVFPQQPTGVASTTIPERTPTQLMSFPPRDSRSFSEYPFN